MSLYTWTGPMPCPSSDPNGPWNEPDREFEGFTCAAENCENEVKHEGEVCHECRIEMALHAND